MCFNSLNEINFNPIVKSHAVLIMWDLNKVLLLFLMQCTDCGWRSLLSSCFLLKFLTCFNLPFVFVKNSLSPHQTCHCAPVCVLTHSLCPQGTPQISMTTGKQRALTQTPAFVALKSLLCNCRNTSISHIYCTCMDLLSFLHFGMIYPPARISLLPPRATAASAKLVILLLVS